MNALWSKFQAWLASKGGAAHVVAGLFLVAVGAYKGVPQFHALVLAGYQAVPSWGQTLIVTAAALYTWYKNNNVALPIK